MKVKLVKEEREITIRWDTVETDKAGVLEGPTDCCSLWADRVKRIKEGGYPIVKQVK